ncbi:MAG: EAL domain-containing protein [Steroidobacteraceae bacterium]
MRPIDPQPFLQLFGSLLPGTRVTAIFDATGQPFGCSDGRLIDELTPIAADALAQARKPSHFDQPGIVHDSPAGRAYAILVRDDLGRHLGAVLAACAPLPGAGKPLPLRQAARLLAPVLALLARELAPSASETSPAQALIAETMQLQRLLDATHAGLDESRQTNAVEPVLAELVEKLDCDFALLCAPAQGIELVAFGGTAPDLDTQVALRLARSQLLHVAARNRGCVILNRVRESAQAELTPFRIVCLSLRRCRRIIGILACFNRLSREPFTKAHGRELEALQGRFAELIGAHHDEATGLLTRQAFEEQALERVSRDPGRVRSLVYGDADRMHCINDVAGFPAGDELLSRMAALWQNRRPTPDSLVGRLSGDRFVALLEDCSTDRSRTWADELRQAIEHMPLPPRCRDARPTVSIGIAAFPAGERLGHALAQAEMACAAAKDRGRNRVEVFAPADASLMQRHEDLHVFRELLNALERGRFRLFAQPIVPLDGRPHPLQFELLLRMIDDDDQIIVPGRFLSAAARYQLLGRLDQWVVEQTIEKLVEHRAILERTPATFWINLSGPSVGNAEFTSTTVERITAAALPAGSIGVEITESTAIGNIDGARSFIGRLRDIGCTTALDDFGTGLSSLAYLRALPVAKLKIDGSFVRDLLRDARAESMVRAMLQLARQLRIETVAECIETPEVATRLALLGVTYGQGFHFSEPVPLERILEAGSRMHSLVRADIPVPGHPSPARLTRIG